MGFHELPLWTRHDRQFTRKISYGFEITDCISGVSWYVYWMEVNDVSGHLRMRNHINLRSINRRCKVAWIFHPIETDGSRDNSELIPEASQPRDASVTKSVKVKCNEFIWELEGYQSLHQWDSISYNPIEPIDDYRDDSGAHASTRVASPAMPKPALLSRFLQSLSDKHNRSWEEHKQAHTSNKVHLRRIRDDSRDMHHSHRAMPPMAVPVAITFHKTQPSYLWYGWC